MMTAEHLVVTAAVIEEDDRFLLTRRPRGTHLEGFWEFPGGKCEPEETLEACLIREIEEELGCRAAVRQELLSVAHDYSDRTVRLHFFRCDLAGEPQALLGQEIKWVSSRELRTLNFPPADEALIQLLAG